MVDVTVDANPKMHLPIDPDTIPDAVKKRAAAVDAMYANGTLAQPAASEPAASEPPPPPPEPEPLPPAPQPVEEPPQSVSRETPRTIPPPPPEDENTESWKSRFISMQGRWIATQKK